MLLAVDTATASASVAVYDMERECLLAETTWLARRRHTQELMSMVQGMLRQADAAIGDVAALAVTTGPGSFTGVRIGISAVKGLGLGLARAPQVVGLPTLCVTAAPWIALAAFATAPTIVCAFIQAGRGRYNWAWFGADDLLSVPGREEHGAGTASEFCEALSSNVQGSVWLAGEADDDLRAAVGGCSHMHAHVHIIDGVSAQRRAGQLARLAAKHMVAGLQDDLETLQPLYLRNP